MIELKEIWTGINYPKQDLPEKAVPTDNSLLQKTIKEAIQEVKTVCEVIEYRFVLSKNQKRKKR